MRNRYVGRPPGTTTIGLGSPWAPNYPNPAQRYMPVGATIVGGANAPHDLELAKIYGYTPYMEGWIMGRKTDQGPGVSVTALEGFGADAATPEAWAAEQRRMDEEIKSMRWNRFVGGVIAVAAVGGLAISIVSLRRR
jgi:hypothetical protein